MYINEEIGEQVMEYKKQYEKENPQVIGEKDKEFYRHNYIDWADKQISDLKKQIKVLEDAILETERGDQLFDIQKDIECRRKDNIFK